MRQVQMKIAIGAVTFGTFLGVVALFILMFLAVPSAYAENRIRPVGQTAAGPLVISNVGPSRDIMVRRNGDLVTVVPASPRSAVRSGGVSSPSTNVDASLDAAVDATAVGTPVTTILDANAVPIDTFPPAQDFPATTFPSPETFRTSGIPAQEFHSDPFVDEARFVQREVVSTIAPNSSQAIQQEFVGNPAPPRFGTFATIPAFEPHVPAGATPHIPAGATPHVPAGAIPHAPAGAPVSAAAEVPSSIVAPATPGVITPSAVTSGVSAGVNP